MTLEPVAYPHGDTALTGWLALPEGPAKAAVLILPTIANANGSAAELPDRVLCMLPDLFTQEQLQEALARFHRNRADSRAAASRPSNSRHARSKLERSPASAPSIRNSACAPFGLPPSVVSQTGWRDASPSRPCGRKLSSR